MREIFAPRNGLLINAAIERDDCADVLSGAVEMDGERALDSGDGGEGAGRDGYSDSQEA